MTEAASIGGRARRLIADNARRRIGYALLTIVLAVLCVVPRPYEARAKLVPQDANSIGLGSMTNAMSGQMGGLGALLGGMKQPVDLYLAVARGAEVTDAVIQRLDLATRFGSEHAARLKLSRYVDVHSLTGGVIEVEVRTHDAATAELLTRAYAQAISDRLRALGEERVERKRSVVVARFAEAGERVLKAESALDAFRRSNNLAEPTAQLGAELSLRAGLQAQLQAKQVELETLRRFQGPENPQRLAVESEVAALRRQIAGSAAPSTSAAGPNVAGLSQVSSRYLELYRDYRFAQALYEVYARSSEEVAVEALASETASDAQLIEAPRLDIERKYNVPAVAALLLLLVAALFTEIYAPATGIRLPWTRRRP